MTASDEAVVVLDEDGLVLGFNRAATRLLGRATSDLAGQMFESLLEGCFPVSADPDGTASVGERYWGPFRRPDGEVLPLLVTLTSLPLPGASSLAGSGTTAAARPDADGGVEPAKVAYLCDLRARREADEVLDRFFDLSENLMGIADLEGYIVRSNPQVDRVFGYRPGELLGENLLERIHPDDLPDALDGLAQLGEKSKQVEFEGRFVRAGGGYRRINWMIASSVRNGLIYGVGRDVTDERAAERELRQSEARLQAILDNSPTAIGLRALDGSYLVQNQAAGFLRRLAGAGGPDGSGAREAARHEQQVIEARRPMVFEEAHDHEGRRHTFVVGRFPLLGDDGSPYAVGFVGTDVTERARAADALAARERLLQSVYRATPDTIVVLRVDGDVVSASSAVTDLLGYDPAELEGRSPADIVHPDDLGTARQLVLDSAGGQAKGVVRVRLRRRDGSYVTVEVRGQALPTGDDEPDQAVCSCRDITAQIEAEGLLLAAMAEAAQANNAKSEFLSRMSHELRTPLNSVLGFAQLLEGTDLSREQRNATNRILRGGTHLLDLINEVLDIAGIESGSLHLASEPVDLREVVADAIDLNRLMASESRVVLHEPAWGPDEPTLVIGDRQRLMQVLLNLISNAIKYNRPSGQVVIGHDRLDGKRLRLTVTDTGIGIRSELASRVFIPFDRLGAERTGIEGVGVGLSLVKRLVERMDGTITFESTEGIGTSFHVDLPMADLDTPQLPVAERRRSVRPAAKLAGRARVVCIEDNPGNLELIGMVLDEGAGMEVIPAQSGAVGLELVRAEQPDLVLLDLHLPGMSGIEVLEALRAEPATASIPVVVVTADASPGSRDQAMAAGASGFVVKPFDVPELLNAVSLAGVG